MINIEKDLRCPHCNFLLMKVEHVKGTIKCPRCKQIVYVEENKDRA